MDYNTQRSQLILPEYGRCIQDMVSHCKTVKDKDERKRCANTIVALMSNLYEKQNKNEDTAHKLWNHLAAMANYELDIDYPVEIEYPEDKEAKRDVVPYPQKSINKRHYGAFVEELTKKLTTMEKGQERDELTRLVANMMKRNLASWNANAMNDEKILDDLAEYTKGEIQLLPSEINLIPDEEILNALQQQGSGKKKKKK